MKKVFKAVMATSSSASGGGGEDGGDAAEASDSLEEALSILRDHRESELKPPLGLPVSIVDPAAFPFFQTAAGGGAGAAGAAVAVQGNVDPYSAALQTEAYNATLFIRDDFIRKQMVSREPSFVNLLPARIWVGTFNCGGKKPEFPVDMFVCNGEKKRNEKSPYDIVVVGFQEIVELNAMNAVSESNTKERSAQWIGLISRSLDDSARRNGEPEGYHLLGYKSLVGLMVCCFSLKKHRANIRGVSLASAATGVMGMVGNKGACSIRFDFFDTSFCFVCAHLAAHVEGIEQRNSDVRSIYAKTSFKCDPPTRSFVPEKHHSRIAATTPEVLARGELLIREHDYLIWLGDFNYRMDASNPVEDVFDRVYDRDLLWLVSHDQLVSEMRAGRVFEGLSEVSNLTFLPTYKFEIGTDQYDRRPEKKLRAPAWTDRILWRTPSNVNFAGDSPTCALYDRIDAVRASDHKPVEAVLHTIVRVINDPARDEAYKEVLKKFDAITAGGSSNLSSAAQMSHSILVSPQPGIDFGMVTYRSDPRSEFLLLKNQSPVPLCWRFVPRPGSNDLCSRWLTLDSSFGLLLPGQEERVQVSCRIGLESARLVASGEYPQTFRDVLDLRVHPVLNQERIHTLQVSLVTITCQLRPTCFGAQISSLLWALRPTASFGTGDEQYARLAQQQQQQQGTNESKAQIVPKELFRLVNRLKNYCGEHRIFLTHALPSECYIIRQCLDEGTAFPQSMSPHAFASVLLEFLDALAEPVIPSDFFPEDSIIVTDPTWPLTFIASLPVPNANVLVLVISLIQSVLNQSSRNRVPVQSLLSLFAEVLFRPAVVAEAIRESSTANASQFGEVMSWMTTSVIGGSANSSKNDVRAASETAVKALSILITINNYR